MVVPISAHALFARPLVVAPTSTIAVEVLRHTAGGVVWCDGRRLVELPPGSRVEVRRHPDPVRFARLHAAPFTDRLVAKFDLPVDGWRAADVGGETRGPVAVIEEIRIRGLGVIEDAASSRTPGSPRSPARRAPARRWCSPASSLLLGGRADAGVVRAGGAPRSRAGCASTRRRGRARPADEAGGELDDGRARARPVGRAEGRSRAWLGGRSVPASVLAELADDLVAVHGQSDQQRLLAPARQREALDRFGGAVARGARSRPTAPATTGCASSSAELDEITAHARERAQEADLLRHGLAEVEAVAPQPGEGRRLAAESSRLAYAESLRARPPRRTTRCAPTTSATTTTRSAAVGVARASLDAQREHDPELGALADRARRGRGHRRGRRRRPREPTPPASRPTRHGSPPSRIVARRWARSPASTATPSTRCSPGPRRPPRRLLELDADDERRTALAEERDALRPRRRPRGRLSRARTAAAAEFSAAVTAELAGLAMPHAQLTVELAQRDATDGLEVDLGDGRAHRVRAARGRRGRAAPARPHAGAPPARSPRAPPAASCPGSCSRSRSCSPASEPVPTLVFDEVDAGVGGRGRGRGRPAPGPARAHLPGPRRHPPAAGRRVRRPARRRGEVRRRARSRPPGCACSRTATA